MFSFIFNGSFSRDESRFYKHILLKNILAGILNINAMNKIFTLSITKALFIGVLLLGSIPLIGQPCVINQAKIDSYSDISATAASGQSFTACATGVVTAIEVSFLDLKTKNLKLNMATGTNTLIPEYTQLFEAKAPGKVLIQLTTPFPVEEYEEYAFSISGISDTNIVAFIYAFTDNPYKEGNLITEINGINTPYEADLAFNLTIVENACALDQPARDDFFNITTTTAIGQNFTACNSGAITMLRVNFSGLVAKALTLQINSGSNTLIPAYTQDFQPDSLGDMVVVLSTPFIIEAGQTYAFSVLGLSSGGADLSAATGNPFPSGNAFSESAGTQTSLNADLDFSITTFENACVIDQPDTNGTFNISNDIAVGQNFLACVTGFVTHIKTGFSSLNTDTLQLRISNGDNTLTPDYIQTFVPDSAGDYLIQLTTPFRVEHNREYAFSVIGFADSGTVAMLTANNGNAYPDGFAFIESGGSSTPAGADIDFSMLTLVCSPSIAGFTFTSNELEVAFSDTSSFADSVLYDFGDGNTAKQFNPTHTYSSPGNYAVSQITYSRCLNDTIVQNITVSCTPAIAGFTASGNNTFSIAFTDTSSVADSVLYDFGDGNTSTDPNPVHTYADVGAYTVIQVAYNSCRNDTVIQSVIVSCPSPTAGFISTISGQFSVAFVDTSSVADSVLYDFGDGNTSADPNSVHTYASAGSYTVCQIAFNHCGNDTICHTVTINCVDPVSTFNTTISNREISFIDASTNANSVMYDFGDGNTSTDPNPVYTYLNPGVYKACQIAYGNCENDTSCTEILVNLTDLDLLEFPEAFTPNDDGINDLWQIEELDLFPDNDLIILNRWGNQVYYAKPYNNDWGGISSTGQRLNRGTYFYILRVRVNRPGAEKETIRGTVTIVY